MKVAIMQPYVFPYLGYFQLIHSVDTFIFYDDVNFIKRGWVNRNRILVNGNEYLFTVPCIKPSQNRWINETLVDYQNPELKKASTTFHQSYKKAPNYEVIAPLFDSFFSPQLADIASLAIHSVISVCEYLDIKKDFKVSSEQNYANNSLERADRLIDITKKEGSHQYVNAIGGMEIYNKEYFQSKGVSLQFLKPKLKTYKQATSTFVAGLSIVDLLMYLPKDEVMSHISDYDLI